MIPEGRGRDRDFAKKRGNKGVRKRGFSYLERILSR
jgi:hypothetical protein